MFQGLRFWLRRKDLNQRPSGYEPDELPGCSTPRYGAGSRGRTGTKLTFHGILSPGRLPIPPFRLKIITAFRRMLRYYSTHFSVCQPLSHKNEDFFSQNPSRFDTTKRRRAASPPFFKTNFQKPLAKRRHLCYNDEGLCVFSLPRGQKMIPSKAFSKKRTNPKT